MLINTYTVNDYSPILVLSMTHLQSAISFGPHIQLFITRDTKRNIIGFHTVVKEQNGAPSLSFEDDIGQFTFPTLEIQYHMGGRPEIRRQWIRQCLINTAQWIQQRAFDLAFDDLQQDLLDSALTAFQDISDYAMPFNKNTVVHFMVVLLGDKGHACDDSVLDSQLIASLDNLVTNPIPSQYLYRILETTSKTFTTEHMRILLQQWLNDNSRQSATHQTIRRWIFERQSPNTLPEWIQQISVPIWGIIQRNPNDDIGIISSERLAIRDNLTKTWTQHPMHLHTETPNLFGLWNGNWWIFDRDSISEWNLSNTPPSQQDVEPFLIIEEILHIDTFQGRPYALGLNANNELYLEIWDRRDKSWLSILGTNDNIGHVYTVQHWEKGCQVFLSTLEQNHWQWLHFNFLDQTVQEMVIENMAGHPLLLNEHLYWLQEDDLNNIICLNTQGETQWQLSNCQPIHSIQPYNDNQFVLIESTMDTLGIKVINISDGSTASQTLTVPKGPFQTLTTLDGHLWVYTPKETYSIFC